MLIVIEQNFFCNFFYKISSSKSFIWMLVQDSCQLPLFLRLVYKTLLKLAKSLENLRSFVTHSRDRDFSDISVFMVPGHSFILQRKLLFKFTLKEQLILQVLTNISMGRLLNNNLVLFRFLHLICYKQSSIPFLPFFSYMLCI